MANSFYVSVAPELAALDAKIVIIDGIVDDIRDVDLVAIDGKIDTIDGIVDDIRDVDLVAIDGKIDIIDTNVDTLISDKTFSMAASDTILASANTERDTTSTTYEKLKEITVTLSGIYRISLEIHTSVAAQVFVSIYRNGVAYSTEQNSYSNPAWALKTWDLFFEDDDLIQVYLKTSAAGGTGHVQNFEVKGISSSLIAFVIID